MATVGTNASATHPEVHRRNLPGGINPIDVDDKDAVKVAEFAVEHVNQKRNQKLQLLHVVKASRQSITGYMYRLTLELASAEEDPAEASQNVKIMDVEVWAHPRMRDTEPWMEVKSMNVSDEKASES